jgi:hypothetical protein
VPHPVGDRDERLIVERGAAIAAECARVLTTRVEDIEPEFAGKQYPLPRGVMPR